MDGSLPAYYIKTSGRSPLPGERRKWLIYFEDGPLCYDEESCDALVAEYPQAASTLEWPETREVDGIFSDDPSNDMADFNKVLVGYCSGDSYISNLD
jgi:hypothetical protein